MRSFGLVLLYVSCFLNATSLARAQLSVREVVAFDRLSASSGGGDDRRLLAFFQDPPPQAYTNTDDGFQKYQLGVDSGIPTALVDESFAVFALDNLGIVDASPSSPGYKTDAWFGVVDTINCDNTASASQCPVITPNGLRSDPRATWLFDISDASDLTVSIDMAAMGNFENQVDEVDIDNGDTIITTHQDRFDWWYSIDERQFEPLFTSLIDEESNQTYSLASGVSRIIPDPAKIRTTEGDVSKLDNIFQTITSSVLGHGNALTISLIAQIDGGAEAYAFDNIVVRGVLDANPVVLPGDYDDDGTVAVLDLNLVLFNWNVLGPDLPDTWINQRPGDGLVGVDELNRVLFNWGESNVVDPLPIAPTRLVPEPGAMVVAWQAMALVRLRSGFLRRLTR